MNYISFIDRLKLALKSDLPGYSAQKIMEPPMRQTLMKSEQGARKAATLLPLYFEKEWKFILIKRSSHPLDKHKGQISFPGGSMENHEKSEETAIREANEEINLPIDSIKLIGNLSYLFIPVSNFIVYPHVAMVELEDLSILKKQETEVEDIIHVKLDDLLDNSNVRYEKMMMANGMQIDGIPIFQLEGHQVWGATAMMLSEFKEICKKRLYKG